MPFPALVRHDDHCVTDAVALLAIQGGVDEATALTSLERFRKHVARSTEELSSLVLNGVISYVNINGDCGPQPY